MDLGTLVVLLLAGFLIFQFWRLRGIAERAVTFAKDYCKKHNLQYISLARSNTKIAIHKGRIDWHVRYQMAFCSDGESEYVGALELHGNTVVNVELPVYRVLE